MATRRAWALAAALLLSSVPAAYALIGTTLDVGSNVVLSYAGLAVGWTSGIYGDCTVSSVSTNCLISGNTPPEQSLFPFAALFALFLFVVLSLLVLGIRRGRRR